MAQVQNTYLDKLENDQRLLLIDKSLLFQDSLKLVNAKFEPFGVCTVKRQM